MYEKQHMLWVRHFEFVPLCRTTHGNVCWRLSPGEKPHPDVIKKNSCYGGPKKVTLEDNPSSIRCMLFFFRSVPLCPRVILTTTKIRLLLRGADAARRLQELLHECLGEYEKARLRGARRRRLSVEACDSVIAGKILDLR